MAEPSDHSVTHYRPVRTSSALLDRAIQIHVVFWYKYLSSHTNVVSLHR